MNYTHSNKGDNLLLRNKNIILSGIKVIDFSKVIKYI